MAFKLAEAFVELNSRGFGGITRSIAGVKRGMSGLISLAGGPLGVALAGAGAAVGAVGLVKLAADAESTQVKFKTLTGSATNAKKIIADLQQFSASTPFQFNGLAAASQELLAFKVSQQDLIPTLSQLGDVAASTGTDVGELASIFGKVKARGTLMTESLDQFNERGIAVGSELASMFGVTDAKIREMASNGEISFSDLQAAMTRMTSEGGTAFNGMADQSKTLGGLWSTLTDNVSLAMLDIGNALVEGFDIKSVTANLTAFVQNFRQDWMPSIVASVKWVGDNIVAPITSAIGTMVSAVFEFVRNSDLYWDLFVANARNQFANFMEVGKVAFINLWEIGKWAFENIGDIMVDIFNFQIVRFQNTAKNIKAIWDSVLNFFRTGEFKINFTPITEGFKSQIKTLPQLTKAELNKLQPEIDALHAKLNQRQREREKAIQKANEEAEKRAETQQAVGAQTAQKTKAPETAGNNSASRFEFVGLADLANKMQAAVTDNSAQVRQQAADAAVRTADKIDLLVQKATNEGIKIKPTEGQSPPSVNRGFGINMGISGA